MDGEWSPIAFDPIMGVNSEDTDTRIDNNELQNARNFLFERQFTLTRPGLKSITLTGTPLNDVVLDDHSLYVGGSPFNMLLTNTAGGGSFLYKFDTSAFTQLTPGALTANSFFFKPISVNGVVLVGNLTAGIQRWLTSGTTLTTITTAKPRYMTGHLSRAIGAYDQVGANGPITVEWSKPGDETTWNTSPSTDGSGLVLLTEIPDVITGLDNLHNVIVVMRTLGITLGYATGVAFPFAFRFETYTRDYGGSPYPRTQASYNNVLYYVGRDNVYSFDLRNITPIGYKIRSSLFANLTTQSGWNQYRGFISTSQRSGEVRARYHLFPSGSTAPHFSYDILDGKWSVHSYTGTPGAGFNYLESGPPSLKEGPAFLDNATASPKVETWDNTINCETASFMVSKTFRTPKYDRDYKVERVLISYKDQGATSSPITVTASGRIGRNIESQPDSQTPGLNNDQHWVRAWWNTRLAAGQDIQIRVDVPAGVQFQTDHMEIAIAELGGLREI